MQNRRFFILGAVALGGGLLAARVMQPGSGESTRETTFEVVKSEAEWREILSPEQFAVLREEATERPYTSPLNAEKRKGVFSCAGCKLELYASETKYDSGTGWPSFYQSLDGAVGTRRDVKLFVPRTEVHCRRCGGHLGHVFGDGPKPTGKRHCINGVSLVFDAQDA